MTGAWEHKAERLAWSDRCSKTGESWVGELGVEFDVGLLVVEFSEG